MAAIWPGGFTRIPDEEWAQQSPDELARKYDTVENHGWYANLEPTVDELAEELASGDILLDYSGGTGIFANRLLRRMGTRNTGILIADSSPKFLGLALSKLGADPRMAFRLIRYLKAECRLERLDEAI